MLRIVGRWRDSTLQRTSKLMETAPPVAVSPSYSFLCAFSASVSCCLREREIEASLCHFKLHLQSFFWMLCRCLWQGRTGCSLLPGGSLNNWRTMGIFRRSISIPLLAGRSQYYQKTLTSLMWQAWSMSICHLTWLAFIVLIMNDSICIFSCSVELYVVLETLNKSHVLSVHFSSPRIGMYIRKLILKILPLRFIAYVAVCSILCKIST